MHKYFCVEKGFDTISPQPCSGTDCMKLGVGVAANTVSTCLNFGLCN